MSLDKTLREIAEGGNFSHLSVLSSGGGFHATFCPASAWGSGHGVSADPVKAALTAIADAPKKPRVKAVAVSPGPVASEPTGRVSPVNLMDLFK